MNKNIIYNNKRVNYATLVSSQGNVVKVRINYNHLLGWDGDYSEDSLNYIDMHKNKLINDVYYLLDVKVVILQSPSRIVELSLNNGLNIIFKYSDNAFFNDYPSLMFSFNNQLLGFLDYYKNDYMEINHVIFEYIPINISLKEQKYNNNLLDNLKLLNNKF